ncbi:MAG TPA: hypothetical protein VL326_35620 [Kofleriaceae bacterium]|nr:hypothetical protein [Kofleriaceae bacterium]
MLRRIAIIAAFLVAGLGVLAIRAVVEGRAAMQVADQAMASCFPIYDARPANAPDVYPPACFVAIDAYETAARWYLPLAPHVDAAYARLRYIARRTDPTTAQRGFADPGTALAAWRAIRSAARATRSLWTPHAGDLDAADAAIARLSGADPASGQDAATTSDGSAATAATPDDTAVRELWHETRLARDVRPSIGAGALAGLGVLLWLTGAVVLIGRGLDRAGVWVRRPAVMAGAAIVLGVVLWFVGLANA